MSIDIVALPADILLHALSFLDHKELSLVARVSHRLHVCVDDPSIWHQLCMGISNIDNNSDTNHTTSTSTTTTTSTISRLYSTDLIVKDRDWKTLYQLMGQVPLSNFASYNLLLHGIEASSTDHPSQSIRETLTNSQQFWSSTGSNTPDANEHLIYQLVHPICIITEMQVWIYQCTYQQGLPIYGPRAIRFSLGYTRDSWHYTSPIYPCNNTPDMQSFRLTPHLRCGGYLKIELLGKVSTQSNDNLWYTVLRQVRCHGIPLVMLPRNVLTRAIVAHATTLTPSWTEEMKSSSTSTSHEDAKAVTTPIQRILSNAGAAVASFISSTSTSTSNDDDDDDEKKHEDMDQVDAVMSHLYATASPLIDTQQHINDVLIQCLSRIDAHDIREAANLVIQHLLPRKHEDVRNRVLTYVKEKATDPMDVVIYLIHLLSRRVILNGMETSTLISIQTSTSGNIPRLQGVFSHAYQLHQVTCTKSIGDQLIAAGKWNAAVAVYVVAHVPDMVLKCLIHQGRVATLVAYIQSLHHFAPWDDVLRDILKLHGLTKALELAILLNEWSGGPLLDPDMIMSILSIRPPANEWNHRTILRAALEQARSNETTSSTSTSSRDDPRLDDLDTILFNGGMQMFMAMADEEGGEEEEDGQEDENEDGDRDGD